MTIWVPLRPLLPMLRGAGRLAAVLTIFVVTHAQAEETPSPELTLPVIERAFFIDPTTRYDHGALGPGAEWGGLVMEREDGVRYRVILDENHVFEDIRPRLADLDGDGADEVLVVETDRRRGARIVVYDRQGKVAATPHIGKPYRWLAIIGSADLDGDGRAEIAYVETPHIAPVLKIVQFRDGILAPMTLADGRRVPELRGVTNHAKGDIFLQGGIADCGLGPHIFVVDASWRQVLEIRLEDGALKSETVADYKGPVSVADAIDCKDPR